MFVLKLLAGLALLGSIAWYIAKPEFDSGLGLIGAIVTFLALFIAEAVVKKKTNKQKQSVSGSSIGIQAGGNVNIGTPKKDDNAE